MDEYQNTFRIATTGGQMWWGSTPQNNLYIYDDNLNLLSKIEGIAENETIQSTRFLGDRIYMVTYKQVDPFFVIDAKDPKNPKILGELKLPGYSTYLQPYDENHVIGFGFDTSVVNYSGTNVTRISGIKMTMFDVTDPQNPQAMFNKSLSFGDNSYSYSEVTYNPKALLFNKDKNLIAFPLSFTSYDNNQYMYKQAYEVYSIDLTNGFTFKTSISHFDTDKANGYQYGYEILRGVYIGDTLYTVSYSQIQAHSLTTYEKLNTLDLNFDESTYYGWVYPMD